MLQASLPLKEGYVVIPGFVRPIFRLLRPPGFLSVRLRASRIVKKPRFSVADMGGPDREGLRGEGQSLGPRRTVR